VDEWQGVRIALEGEPQPLWWMVPIETISQSESGFERVYQGSAILAVWKVDSPSWRNIACTLRAEVSQVEPRAGLNGPAAD
jgi:alpha-amylase